MQFLCSSSQPAIVLLVRSLMEQNRVSCALLVTSSNYIFSKSLICWRLKNQCCHFLFQNFIYKLRWPISGVYMLIFHFDFAIHIDLFTVLGKLRSQCFIIVKTNNDIIVFFQFLCHSYATKAEKVHVLFNYKGLLAHCNIMNICWLKT